MLLHQSRFDTALKVGIWLIVIVAAIYVAPQSWPLSTSFYSAQCATGFVVIGLGIFSMILVGLVSSALESILLAAIYLYAAEGRVSDHFDGDLIEHAYVQS